ncbi:hypothetical protein ABBQ38_001363 [Trebouxia sp. C0009 RCD-2024]
MLTDAFEKQQSGVNIADTLSDALKEYPAQPRSGRSRSILPKLQCFRPSSSRDNPSRTELRKQLDEAQVQYQHLSDQSQHQLTGSVSDTLRLDRDKKAAEAQAEQAEREVQQLQRALQESEARAAAVSQRLQQDVLLLTLHVKELANQAHRVSTQLQTVRGDSISRLMQTAWEGGTDLKVSQSSQVSDALASLQDLHQDLDRAQQQVSLLENNMKGRALADWQAQQRLQTELLSLQSQQWWGAQLAKGSIGLGCAYVGGVWWATKGVTRLCLIPVTIPTSIVQRVFDSAKGKHLTITHETYHQCATDSREVGHTTDKDQPRQSLALADSNPMLGKAVIFSDHVS